MAPRRRLDVRLAESGLAPSRQAAQGAILAGRVTVDGRRVDKPGTLVDEGAAVAMTGPPRPFASRGGIKLAGALDAFGIEVADRIAVDLGASTGGFTDCLLKRGAARVYAVDVGHGQLDWSLRNDPRVIPLEGINARYLAASELPGLDEGAGLVTLDLSFISLTLVLPRVPALLRREAPHDVVALVKPQFEAGRGAVGRGGIVRDPVQRATAVAKAARCAIDLGLAVRGVALSALPGAEGNREFFLHASPEGPGMTPEAIDERARQVAEDPE